MTSFVEVLVFTALFDFLRKISKGKNKEELAYWW